MCAPSSAQPPLHHPYVGNAAPASAPTCPRVEPASRQPSSPQVFLEGSQLLENIMMAPADFFTYRNLPHIKQAIARLKVVTENLYENEFVEMTSTIIETASHRLANAKYQQTEPPT